ncbi:hypothetical protein CC78DRAFT_613821 [Lojkania enalia]|uniref:Archaemetzincin-2 n=1 Tax=Lojkania enalia TaxID=147567 RepID=A0A9P4N5Z4_9PLEO|nr:hypothetical protein CC78DRAFT_613821 [Didymosphaeria enalia]
MHCLAIGHPSSELALTGLQGTQQHSLIVRRFRQQEIKRVILFDTYGICDTMFGSLKPCLHRTLQLESSAYAPEAGFTRPHASRRAAATTKTGKTPKPSKRQNRSSFADSILANTKRPSTFPGPLVLPDDDLHWDPKWPPQSFRSWLHEKERNKPTQKRKKIYVASVPEIGSDMAFMKDWIQANIEAGKKPAKRAKLTLTQSPNLASPDISHFISYLTAFYHGMPIRQLPLPIRFVPWKEKTKNDNNLPTYIGLAIGDRITRIRVRPSPDGTFKGQLNLNDILDAAIDSLPADAYSVMFLVDHDIYEDEDDDFCCGRAYGGSRVAVVSTARYNPALDILAGIDYSHMWPASHCKEYVDRLCAAEGLEPAISEDLEESSPLRAAVDAVVGIALPSTSKDLQALWFSRLCRTVAHELGHCLGMDHCVYYACNMQGTAGMAEDVRQPPYLCPVCLSKVSHAIAGELLARGDESRIDAEKRIWAKQRDELLLEFCGQWKDVGMFAGFKAWLGARLGEQTGI